MRWISFSDLIFESAKSRNLRIGWLRVSLLQPGSNRFNEIALPCTTDGLDHSPYKAMLCHEIEGTPCERSRKLKSGYSLSVGSLRCTECWSIPGHMWECTLRSSHFQPPLAHAPSGLPGPRHFVAGSHCRGPVSGGLLVGRESGSRGWPIFFL